MRTRRSVRIRREKLGEIERGVRTNGLFEKMHLVQCRADSVKHAASPSRRDSSQRVVMSPVISTSVRCCRTPECPAPLRRVPQSFRVDPQPNPLAGAAPSSLPWSRTAFPGIRALVALGEIWTQNSRSHIAMSYEPSTAWKASLRAHRRRFARPLKVLKPRWSQEPLNAASDLITTL